MAFTIAVLLAAFIVLKRHLRRPSPQREYKPLRFEDAAGSDADSDQVDPSPEAVDAELRKAVESYLDEKPTGDNQDGDNADDKS